MKKITSLFCILMLACCMIFGACTCCHRNAEPVDEITYPTTGLNVEETIMDDFGYMGFHYENYDWMECCIDMENYLDETDTANVLAVANIYKVIDTTNGLVFKAVLIAHTADTTVYEEKLGLWVGDDNMNDYWPINIDFAHAYNHMMIANCVKPHSKHCVLRKEVGPKAGVDPIYIFGNQDAQVYVMSNTGDVTTTNPVFPENCNDAYVPETIEYDGTIYGARNTRIGCPLGEWP